MMYYIYYMNEDVLSPGSITPLERSTRILSRSATTQPLLMTTITPVIIVSSCDYDATKGGITHKS